MERAKRKPKPAFKWPTDWEIERARSDEQRRLVHGDPRPGSPGYDLYAYGVWLSARTGTARPSEEEWLRQETRRTHFDNIDHEEIRQLQLRLVSEGRLDPARVTPARVVQPPERYPYNRDLSVYRREAVSDVGEELVLQLEQHFETVRQAHRHIEVLLQFAQTIQPMIHDLGPGS